MPASPPDLLILGASARAAAWSALRAGLTPTTADLFADRDLAAFADAARVEPGAYPDGLEAAAGRRPGLPWIYTGALENRPALVERIARRQPLWGNDGPTLRRVRDPLVVASALRDAGLPTLDVRIADPTGLPRDGSWLRKPVASAGGAGIAPLVDGLAPADRPSYFQKRVEGTPLAALFVGRRGGACLFAGLTRQLVGRPGAPFAYAGSIGPWALDAAAEATVRATGELLAGRFGLVGLFGVDLVLDPFGVPFPTEVNPRYTASVEVIELATGTPLVGLHRRACEGGRVEAVADPGRFVAKAVIYAKKALTFREPVALPASPDSWPFRVPGAADLPEPGTTFLAGQPVLTVFAEGDTQSLALQRLGERRTAWDDRLRSAR